jgi:glycerol uptake facilitator-like aquaporin
VPPPRSLSRIDGVAREARVLRALGTAFLLAAVVGSGIMAQRLLGGNVALALLGNTLPTGAMLVVLILIFGPLSGAPAVTIARSVSDTFAGIAPSSAPAFLAAQFAVARKGSVALSRSALTADPTSRWRLVRTLRFTQLRSAAGGSRSSA